MVERIKINPYHVSMLLGPLALAVANDRNSDIFESIDYSNIRQCRLIVGCLIRPRFDRLCASTQLEVERALGYFMSHSDELSPVIENKLLVCEIPPACWPGFLRQTWIGLFGDKEPHFGIKDEFSIETRPLKAGDISFAHEAQASMDELISELRIHLLTD